MPVDLEMLLSASPPLFAYSAFADVRFGLYSNPHPFNNKTSNGMPYQRRNFFNVHIHSAQSPLQFAPSSPCHKLPLIHDEETSCGSDDAENIDHPNKDVENNQTNLECEEKNNSRKNGICCMKSSKGNNCAKKRVSFADDKGLPLVDVKVIKEAWYAAPKWAEDFFSLITRGVKPDVTSEKKWEPMFPQPVSDQLVFRKKLENNLVSLENVAMDPDSENMLTGTIKVKNTSFEKEVFLRITFDRWMTSVDVPATYVSVDGSTDDQAVSTEEFDTFQFSSVIPSSAVRYEVVEFCICFQSNGQEYWDNNGGINYRLVISESKKPRLCGNLQPHANECGKETFTCLRFEDAFKANADQWSGLSSWNHLITDRPYW